METEIMNRSSFDMGSTKSNKRRRTAKSVGATVNNNLLVNQSSPGSVSSVFNEMLIMNSSTSPSMDGQKPRSHANARERDRTHRCVTSLTEFSRSRVIH